MPIIELAGKAISYQVRRSNRAKRISLKYSHDKGLEVIYPMRQRNPAPPEVLRQKSSWILSTLEKAQEIQAKFPPRKYECGETFYVLGQPYVLERQIGSALSKAQAELDGATLLVSLPAAYVDGANETTRLAVIALYRQLAHAHLPPRLSELAAMHGFNYKKLRIKNQKTRWGSCSAKGNINLNLRLMMTPPAAIDYVIIHELCHLRLLNHSGEFWALLETICPDYRRWRDWFKENSRRLVL